MTNALGDGLGLLLQPAVPLWAGVIVLLVTAIRMTPHWMEKYFQYLRDKQAVKESDRNWMRQEIAQLNEMLIAQRTADAAFRVAQLAENEACRTALAAVQEELLREKAIRQEELAIERAERLRLERLLLAEGEVRQRAAEVVAADRAAREEEDKRKS